MPKIIASRISGNFHMNHGPIERSFKISERIDLGKVVYELFNFGKFSKFQGGKVQMGDIDEA